MATNAERIAVSNVVKTHRIVTKPLANPIPEDFSLVPWEGVRIVAEVMTAALVDHDRDGWRMLPRREHVSRAMRHLATYLVSGNEEELRHAACRVLFALETR